MEFDPLEDNPYDMDASECEEFSMPLDQDMIELERFWNE